MPAQENGFGAYKNLIITEIQDLKSTVDQLRKEIHMLHIDITVIKAKAATYGILGGGLMAVVLGVIEAYIIHGILVP